MLATTPKSSETRAIMLLISGVSEHLENHCRSMGSLYSFSGL
jgi:hypothetical protein